MSFVFTDKPAGATTHTSLNASDKASGLRSPTDGFKEHLEARLSSPLYVVHRLDRDTTGVLCFAQEASAAAQLIELFKNRQVEKTYYFLTDKVCAETEFTVESYIERKGSTYVSTAPSRETPANALTRFKLERKGRISLWRAEPETGRSHQIRLHAQDKGIAILGDQEHGGSRFPSLCLHSAQMRFELGGEVHRFESPLPRWFSNLEFAQNPRLTRWLSAIDRRERLLRSYNALSLTLDPSDQTTLRWIHSEGDPLRLEQLGTVQSLSWFEDLLPKEDEWADIELLSREFNWGPFYLQVRGNRGRSPNEEAIRLGPCEVPVRWTALENGVTYEFRRDSGLSPGLFLDQRRNRSWVRAHARGKSVLNLFSYTGGFSVCAALGGATKTVSVDVSKTFVEWTKQNFTLNHLSLEGQEFRVMDSRDYLDWAAKKGHRFDLVICDPPSFGRSKSGVFKIDADFDSLLNQLLCVTSAQGRILFSTNFEKWSLEELARRTVVAASKSKVKTRLEPTPDADWDFELPHAEAQNMKSLFIIRE